jgi:hypothetical protein
MIYMYKTKRTTYTRFTLIVFLIVPAYLVIPFIEVPLLGLSISAPLLFFVVLEAVFRPPRPWSKIYRPYIILAVLIWIAIFLSASVNGLLTGGWTRSRP